MSIDQDQSILDILRNSQTIGLMGLSNKPERASYQVAAFWSELGRRVIGVNPALAGQVFFGETVVASVENLPQETDLIDIFRRSETIEPIVNSAVMTLPNLKTIWMQLGVENANAREFAQQNGIKVIENRCPKIDYARLFPAQDL